MSDSKVHAPESEPIMPTAIGRNGIHISAQLRIDALQLRSHGISWAADCMESAAKHIDALEDQIMKTKFPEVYIDPPL